MAEAKVGAGATMDAVDQATAGAAIEAAEEKDWGMWTSTTGSSSRWVYGCSVGCHASMLGGAFSSAGAGRSVSASTA